MSELQLGQSVVKVGTYLYAGNVVCDIRIIQSPVLYGSGDHEDPPEIRDDQDRQTFYVQFGSTSARGVFNAESGAYSSLAKAMAGAGAAPGVGSSIQWQDE